MPLETPVVSCSRQNVLTKLPFYTLPLYLFCRAALDLKEPRLERLPYDGRSAAKRHACYDVSDRQLFENKSCWRELILWTPSDELVSSSQTVDEVDCAV